MKFFVLTYHSHNISGSDYARNDHVALAADLSLLQAVGATIFPLAEVARKLGREAGAASRQINVALSFDDGPLFDFADFVHPEHGPQRGFLNILRDFRSRHGPGALPGLHATSFVIASPLARSAMQRSPDCGYTFVRDWLRDDWWAEAASSGLMDIGNHSWDHVHHAAQRIAAKGDKRDDFAVVGDFDDAQAEIRAASDFIAARAGCRPRLFAFPFGHVNDYLVKEYLPQHGPSFGLEAAFATGGAASERDSVWSIPRLVCGHHWHSPAELERLLLENA